MTLLAQIFAALAIGAFYYMVAVVMTVYDGLLSLIFQPLMGVAFTAVAIAALLVIGLPIRLSKPINEWWLRFWWVPFILG